MEVERKEGGEKEEGGSVVVDVVAFSSFLLALASRLRLSLPPCAVARGAMDSLTFFEDEGETKKRDKEEQGRKN